MVGAAGVVVIGTCFLSSLLAPVDLLVVLRRSTIDDAAPAPSTPPPAAAPSPPAAAPAAAALLPRRCHQQERAAPRRSSASSPAAPAGPSRAAPRGPCTHSPPGSAPATPCSSPRTVRRPPPRASPGLVQDPALGVSPALLGEPRGAPRARALLRLGLLVPHHPRELPREDQLELLVHRLLAAEPAMTMTEGNKQTHRPRREENDEQRAVEGPSCTVAARAARRQDAPRRAHEFGLVLCVYVVSARVRRSAL